MTLEVSGLVTSYNGIPAVRGVTITVPRGKIVSLVGPNGAGKSTLINTVSGVLRPDRGCISHLGTDVTGWSAHRVARAGILQVPEGRQVFGPLSVEDNLRLGAHAARARNLASPDEKLQSVYQQFPVLRERRRQRSEALSGGQQQMLAIGRALMGEPELLLLDEPSLGLAPIVTAQVFRALQTLNASGLTILLVEQNANLALRCSDYAYVIEQGKVVQEGTGKALLKDGAVITHYLGTA